MLLDEPQMPEPTYLRPTGGRVAAPAVGEIVARIAPILGVERSNEDPDARTAMVRAALMPEMIP
ncbi:MAG: cell division protein FtsI (penicillin-binding protein 3) [Maricaulis maris]